MKNPDEILEELVGRYPALEVCRNQIRACYEIIADCFEQGGLLMIAGNGGSYSDSEHICGELMKGFISRRELKEADKKALLNENPEDGKMLGEKLQYGFRAIALGSQSCVYTAAGNDLGANMELAQEVMALGRKNDVFLGISTSGNARNIELASYVAGAKDVHVIGLTGRKGGKLREIAEMCVTVPEDETYKIQELHLPVYHAICMMLESRFFGK